MAAPRQEFPIEQQLRKDIQDAQRARDQVRLDTLRMAWELFITSRWHAPTAKTRSMGSH